MTAPRLRVSLRMSEAELSAVDELAKQAKLSRSEYLRRMALRSDTDTSALDEQLLCELKTLGADLNTLKHCAIEKGDMPKRLTPLLHCIEQIVMKVVNASV